MGATRCPVGTYRAWLAPRSNTGIVVAVLAAVGLLAMPASVEASLYIWNVDANGSWTTASNWLYAGGGPNGSYPNAPGDQAFFTAEYTAARTVTIPAGVTVTVGAIYFGTPQRIDVVGSGSSRLVLNNGASAAQLTTTSPTLLYFLNVTMLLRSSVVAIVNADNTLFLARMVEDGGAHGHEARERNDREIVTDYSLRAGATIRSSPAWKAEYASDGQPSVLRTGRRPQMAARGRRHAGLRARGVTDSVAG